MLALSYAIICSRSTLQFHAIVGTIRINNENTSTRLGRVELYKGAVSWSAEHVFGLFLVLFLFSMLVMICLLQNDNRRGLLRESDLPILLSIV